MSTSKMGFTEGIGINVASHAFTEDGVTKHMERIAPGAGVLSALPAATTVSAIGLVGALSVNCEGKGRIIFSAKATTSNGDFCTARLVFKAADGAVIGMSVLTQSTFAELESGGSPSYRYGTVSAFANDCCAATVELYVVQLPSTGSMLVSLSAV